MSLLTSVAWLTQSLHHAWPLSVGAQSHKFVTSVALMSCHVIGVLPMSAEHAYKLIHA